MKWRLSKNTVKFAEPKFWRVEGGSQTPFTADERSNLPIEILKGNWNDKEHEFSSDGALWYAPTRYPLLVYKSGSNSPHTKRFAITEVRDGLKTGELTQDDKILVSTIREKKNALRIYQLKAFCTYDVFISYRHTSKSEAIQIRDALRGEGVRVWFDHERMELGRQVDNQLFSGVKSSACILALITNNDTTKEVGERDYCHEERTFAFRILRLVLPVRTMQSPTDPVADLPDDLLAKNLNHIDLSFDPIDSEKVKRLARTILSDARSQPFHRPVSVAAMKYWSIAVTSLRLIGLPANTAMLIALLVILPSGLASLGIAISVLASDIRESREQMVANVAGLKQESRGIQAEVETLRVQPANEVLVDVRDSECRFYSLAIKSGNANSDDPFGKSEVTPKLNVMPFLKNGSPINKLIELKTEFLRSSLGNRIAILSNWVGRPVNDDYAIHWRVKPRFLDKRSRIDVANALGDMARIIQSDFVQFLAKKQHVVMPDDWLMVYFAGESIIVIHETNPGDEIGDTCQSILFTLDESDRIPMKAREKFAETIKLRVSASSEEIRDRSVILIAGEFGIPPQASNENELALKLLPINPGTQSFSEVALRKFFEIDKVSAFMESDGRSSTMAADSSRIRILGELLEVLNEYKSGRYHVWVQEIQ